MELSQITYDVIMELEFAITSEPVYSILSSSARVLNIESYRASGPKASITTKVALPGQQ